MAEDLCEECGKGSGGCVLLVCDGCDCCCHLKCTRPRLRRRPACEWYCAHWCVLAIWHCMLLTVRAGQFPSKSFNCDQKAAYGYFQASLARCRRRYLLCSTANGKSKKAEAAPPATKAERTARRRHSRLLGPSGRRRWLQVPPQRTPRCQSLSRAASGRQPPARLPVPQSVPGRISTLRSVLCVTLLSSAPAWSVQENQEGGGRSRGGEGGGKAISGGITGGCEEGSACRSARNTALCAAPVTDAERISIIFNKLQHCWAIKAPMCWASSPSKLLA